MLTVSSAYTLHCNKDSDISPREEEAFGLGGTNKYLGIGEEGRRLVQVVGRTNKWGAGGGWGRGRGRGRSGGGGGCRSYGREQ